jgi:hypothetical protein
MSPTVTNGGLNNEVNPLKGVNNEYVTRTRFNGFSNSTDNGLQPLAIMALLMIAVWLM